MASKQNRHNTAQEDGLSHGRPNVQVCSDHHGVPVEEVGAPQERTQYSRRGNPMDLDVSTSAPKLLVSSGQVLEINGKPIRTRSPIPSPKHHERVSDSQALEHENIELKNKLNMAQKSVNGLRRQLGERQSHQPQLVWPFWFRKSDNEDDYHRLKSDLSARDAELQRCQASLRRVEANEAGNRRGIAFLKEENFSLRKQLKIFEAEIKRSQEKSIREMTDGRWVPVPDDELRNWLNMLHRDIRDWAKQWVGGPLELDTLPSDTRRDFVQTYLSRVVPVTEGCLPRSIEMQNSKMKEKLPLLLLTGVLAYEVQSQFFDNPFFCFEEGRHLILKEMYKELIEANPREGHIWRSTMWRIMNPPRTRDQSRRDQEVANETFRRMQTMCHRVSADFKKGHTKVLLRTLEPQSSAKMERAKKLRDIFMNAASIATALWTQRAFIRSLGIKQFGSTPFSIESPIMEAHPLNRLDDQDPQNNGRKIGIVTRPSLLACGEDNHEGYDVNAFRVLAKAVVWLED